MGVTYGHSGVRECASSRTDVRSIQLSAALKAFRLYCTPRVPMRDRQPRSIRFGRLSYIDLALTGPLTLCCLSAQSTEKLNGISLRGCKPPGLATDSVAF